MLYSTQLKVVNMFGKNLHLCFSKIHCLPTSFSLDDDVHHHHQQQIMKSFNSLYDLPSTAATDPSDPDDFSLVVASSHHRFFVSAPGTSNSILHSKPTSAVLNAGAVPVRKYSPDPYMDFRDSMEEMLRARRDQITGPTTPRLLDEWEYLHDLLMSYLSLNPKRAHKFIIGAFIDLVLSSS